MADAMGLSRRSMQRRLNEQGWSYKRVVDDTRAELARRYMGDRSKSLTEIAFLLGFSEQSAFSRAFRRWTGLAPRAFRLLQA
jgi:AraC-like DNA-binding protein